MRRILALLLLWALVVPAVAHADPAAAPQVPRRECKRLTRQIAHYADVADLARSRDNDLWEQSTMEHISRLSDRRAKLCPQYAKRPAGEELVKFLKNAAKIAATLFAWGLI